MAPAKEALSANEAAAVTGVPLKHVHRIVDAGLLAGAVENHAGTRVIVGGRALVGLKLAYQTADLLTPKGRRRLVEQLLQKPQARQAEESALTLDVRPIESAIRRGLNSLEKAKKMVAVDRDVLSGTPRLKGTRIPVHDIAAMIANGDEIRRPQSLSAAHNQIRLITSGWLPSATNEIACGHERFRAGR
jgi:hypothetical protein